MSEVIFWVAWFLIEAGVFYLVGYDVGYKAKERENNSLFHPEDGWVNVKTFNTIKDAQKWLAEQLSDMIEEEFRRQVAEQTIKEEKEGQ